MGRKEEQTMSRVWPLVWVGKLMCWVRWKPQEREVIGQWGIGLIDVDVEVTGE